MHIEGMETDKVYAIIIVKHNDGDGEAFFVKAPDCVSDTVNELSKRYPDSKLRVYEHGMQR